MRPLVLAAALATTVGFSPGAFGQEPAAPVTLTGIVIDSAGRPIKGATVARSWTSSPTSMTPQNPVVTGDDGTFALDVPSYFAGREVGVLARSANGAFTGIAVGAPASDDDERRPAEVTLRKSIQWTATLTWEGLATKPSFSASVSRDVPSADVYRLEVGDNGEIGFAGPTGDYELFLYSSDLQIKFESISLDEREAHNDGGVIAMTPTVLAQHYGKAPPAWTVTDARNTGGNTKPALGDFRGKWLLIEFWGFW